MWWERCWAPELGLGRLFSSLEGSIHSLCPGWDGASLSSLVKSFMGGLKGLLGTSQHRHAGVALACFGLAACVPPH